MKVIKDNVVKDVEDCLVADYVTAGWTVESENKANRKEIDKKSNKDVNKYEL